MSMPSNNHNQPSASYKAITVLALLLIGWIFQGCGGGGNPLNLQSDDPGTVEESFLNQDAGDGNLQLLGEGDASVQPADISLRDLPAGELPPFPVASPDKGISRADFPISIDGDEAYESGDGFKGWEFKSESAVSGNGRMELPSSPDNLICWATYRVANMDGEFLETISLVGGSSTFGDRYGILIANWTLGQWDVYPPDISSYYWSNVQITNLGQKSPDYISETGDLVWCIASFRGSNGFVEQWTVSGSSDDVLAPSLFWASKGEFLDRIEINWNLAGFGSFPDGVRIFRAAGVGQDVGSFAEVADITSGYTWDDDTVADDGDYTYYAIAYKAGWPDSPPSGHDYGHIARLQRPAELTASKGDFTDKIRVTWLAPESGPAPEQYQVYRDLTDGGSGFAPIGTPQTGLVFDDDTVVDGAEYSYTVVSQATDYRDSEQAFDDYGFLSQLQPPVALACSKKTFDDRIRLTWELPSAGITPEKFQVFRNTTEDNWPDPSTPIAEVDYPATSYDDVSPGGSPLYYRLQSARVGWDNSPSSLVDRGQTAADMYPPDSLFASQGTYMAKVELSWVHPSGGEIPDKYAVYRATSQDGSYTLQGHALYPDSRWIDHSVPDGYPYWYKVTSLKSGFSESSYSSPTDGWTTQLPPPSNVAATKDILDRVDITWDNPLADPVPTGYYVYRTTEVGLNEQPVWNDPPLNDGNPVTSGPYIDNTVTDGSTEYVYSVTSYHPDYPEIRSAGFDWGYRRQLIPPTNWSAVGGNDSITINWTDVTDGNEQIPDGYLITMYGAGDPQDVSQGVETFEYTTVGDDSEHTFEIRSYKAGWGDSPPTSSFTGSTLPLQPPTACAATDGSVDDVVTITWSVPGSGTDPTGYDVYRSDTEFGTYVLLGADPDNVSPYNDTPTDGNTYWYKIKSTKTGYTDSGFSNSDSGYRSQLVAPTITNVTRREDLDMHNDKIVVSWDAPASGQTPGGYEVFRETGTGTNVYISVGTVNHDGNPSYTHSDPYNLVYPTSNSADRKPIGNGEYRYKVSSTKTGWNPAQSGASAEAGSLLLYSVQGFVLKKDETPLQGIPVVVTGGCLLPGGSGIYSGTAVSQADGSYILSDLVLSDRNGLDPPYDVDYTAVPTPGSSFTPQFLDFAIAEADVTDQNFKRNW